MSENKILALISKEVVPKLPLTMLFVQNQSAARNEELTVDMVKSARVKVNFYNNPAYDTYGYSKPISKMIDYKDHE